MSDRETITTYDRVAGAFADRHWNAPLEAQREGFARSVTGGATPERFRILDAGCGPGRDSQWFQQRGFHVVGVDLSMGMLAEARRRVPGVQFALADLRHLGFPAGTFDGIWCSASLLHLPRADVPSVLDFCHRLLGDGWLWLSLKAGEGDEVTDRVYGRGLLRRFTYFSAVEVESLLRRTGFEIIDLQQEQPTDVEPYPWLTVLARTIPR